MSKYTIQLINRLLEARDSNPNIAGLLSEAAAHIDNAEAYIADAEERYEDTD